MLPPWVVTPPPQRRTIPAADPDAALYDHLDYLIDHYHSHKGVDGFGWATCADCAQYLDFRVAAMAKFQEHSPKPIEEPKVV